MPWQVALHVLTLFAYNPVSIWGKARPPPSFDFIKAHLFAITKRPTFPFHNKKKSAPSIIRDLELAPENTTQRKQQRTS